MMTFIAGSIFEAGICEACEKVPVIVGNVLRRVLPGILPQPVMTAAKQLDGRKSGSADPGKTGEAAEEAMKLFRKGISREPDTGSAFTDRIFRPGTFDYLKIRAGAGPENTYGYMFQLEQAGIRGTLPWHNAEIPMYSIALGLYRAFLHSGNYGAGADNRGGCWCSFARTGRLEAAEGA